MRVLIVDDSVVFRSQIKAALEGSALIEVVGSANNGKIALQKLAQTSGVDLITLDMEMPEMNGLETILEIKKAKFPVKIIVFSSQTSRGSEAALDALRAGADDFVSKPQGENANYESAAQRIKEELLPKILQFSSKEKLVSNRTVESKTEKSIEPSPFPKKNLDTFLPSVIVIGSSTGGPPALEKILANLPKPIKIPILIAQHMPPVFTASLAKRIAMISGIEASEAIHGEPLKNNHIYIAPGNFHLSIVKNQNQFQLCLDQNPPRNSVRPAVDTLFESAAEIFGPRVLSIVLTGMGEDGLIGAKAIKNSSGAILIQNKASCVVFGMPGAIYNAGIQDEIMDLSDIHQLIIKKTT